MRHVATLLFMIVFAGMSAVLSFAGDRADDIHANLGSNFSGSFLWDAGGEVQKVQVTIERVRLSAERLVVATGTGQYDSAGKIINFNVMWQIDPKSLRFEMWEASPSSDSFVADGSHVGTISEDLKSISARWTTKGSGEQGTLELTDDAAAADEKSAK